MKTKKKDMKKNRRKKKVGFLSQICIACYSMLYRILPNTRPMYAMALKNLERWKAKADRIEKNLVEAEIKLENNDDEDSEATNNMDEIKDKVAKLKIKEESALVIDVVHDSLSWEEEQEEIVENEMTRSGIWKDIDRAMWIDEEGAVVSESSLKACVSNKRSKEK